MKVSKIFPGLILSIILLKLKLFLQYKHFFTSRCYLLCMPSVKIMDISVLVVFKSSGFGKNLHLLFL